MKRIKQKLSIIICIFLANCTSNDLPLNQYPHTMIANEAVSMKVFLPDPEKGMYRATRFDWSGVIGSLTYRGHDYFGYWKKTHDPYHHEDLSGPVEGFLEAGMGYEEAEAGGKFIRIGVGIIEKPDEAAYNWSKRYQILDHGKWEIDQGKDWITFTHEVESDFGYGYRYEKTLRLKPNGFLMEHRLQNTGEKVIETDQFNHNFFVIDGEKSGPAFNISFPYAISTEDDLKGYLEVNDNSLSFLREMDKGVYLELSGYSKEVVDHQVTVVNNKSGAGVTFTVDKPLYRMAFWACETTLSPENFIWISVAPGEEETWTADYTLFVQEGG